MTVITITGTAESHVLVNPNVTGISITGTAASHAMVNPSTITITGTALAHSATMRTATVQILGSADPYTVAEGEAEGIVALGTIDLDNRSNEQKNQEIENHLQISRFGDVIDLRARKRKQIRYRKNLLKTYSNSKNRAAEITLTPSAAYGSDRVYIIPEPRKVALFSKTFKIKKVYRGSDVATEAQTNDFSSDFPDDAYFPIVRVGDQAVFTLPGPIIVIITLAAEDEVANTVTYTISVDGVETSHTQADDSIVMKTITSNGVDYTVYLGGVATGGASGGGGGGGAGDPFFSPLFS